MLNWNQILLNLKILHLEVKGTETKREAKRRWNFEEKKSEPKLLAQPENLWMQEEREDGHVKL